MQRYILNESDIIQANDSFIKGICKKYGKGLSWDDCLMVAYEGFLYAIRTYRKAYHQFHPYAETCLKHYLEQEREWNNRQKRVESNFSLDQPISSGGHTETVGSTFFAAPDHVSDCVIFADYLESLSSEHQIIAKLYAQGYTAEEILSITGISIQRQHEIKEDLKNS